MRAFVALELPDEARAAFTAFAEHVRAALPPGAARFVRPDDLHVTLVFLGDVDPERRPDLERALRRGTEGAGAPRLRIARPGAFPSVRRPTVVWGGVAGELEVLAALQRRLEREFAFVREPERRAFRPHVTVARLRAPSGAARDALERACELHAPPEIPWIGRTVALLRSTSTRDGARYEALERVALGAA